MLQSHHTILRPKDIFVWLACELALGLLPVYSQGHQLLKQDVRVEIHPITSIS